jgi:hypothetical protein
MLLRQVPPLALVLVVLLLLLGGAVGKPPPKPKMGSELSGDAEIAARRCAICEYVVDSLDKRIRNDFREGKTMEVGWRMDDVDKGGKRRIAKGLSEAGFLEHLEASCAQSTLMPSLLYENEGALRLVDANITNRHHPDFPHTCVPAGGRARAGGNGWGGRWE